MAKVGHEGRRSVARETPCIEIAHRGWREYFILLIELNTAMKVSELLIGKLKPLKRLRPLRQLRSLRGGTINQPRRSTLPRFPPHPRNGRGSSAR